MLTLQERCAWAHRRTTTELEPFGAIPLPRPPSEVRKASSSRRAVFNGPGISITGFSEGFPGGVLWEKCKHLSNLSGLYETFQEYKALLSLPPMT